MMGRQEVQQALFYRFRTQDHVPADHLLRRIDWLLDFGAIRHELETLYSHSCRPSVDPELMIRILLTGYLYAIPSERRLMDEVHLNLAFHWFCRLGLEGRGRTDPPFPRTDMAVLLMATSCAGCSGWLLKRDIAPHVPVLDRQIAHDLSHTEEFAVSHRKRKKFKMLCAHLKRNPGFTRLRLSGQRGASDEYIRAAMAQNLKLPAKRVPA